MSGCFRRVWQRYVDWAKFTYNIPDPVLLPDEHGVTEALASLVRGLLPSQGRLVLTNRRLIYMPMYLRYAPAWPASKAHTTIFLATVISVQRRSPLALWGGLPGSPGVVIQEEDGTRTTFQVPGAGAWVNRIRALMDAQTARRQFGT